MQTPSSGAWTFVPAARRIPYEPDYFVAVCARQQETLDRTLEQTHNIMYELAADRLGERIRDQMTVQAVLDETFRRIADKDAYIAHLEHELERQGAWATDLEKQILALRSTWYVRLFSRRLRRETPRDDAHH